jgi:hypothetical protein
MTTPDLPAELDRLADLRAAYASLAPRVISGEPWPLAERFGTEPEAAWGAREVLAHVAEMLPFWLGELERIVEHPGPGPTPFGRSSGDVVRVGLIERDRTLPLRVLSARVDAGLRDWGDRSGTLTPAGALRDRPRRGTCRPAGGDPRRAVLGLGDRAGPAMFILYAIPIGIVAGYLLGGRLGRLGDLQFRWAWLAIAGLLVQVVLFSPAVAPIVGDAGPAIYVVSTAAVLAAVVRNWRIPGLIIVALGAASNLLAIASNGGVMPASPEAVATLGTDAAEGFSNSVVMTDPALRILTDIFALPAWVPAANVFSIGDVLIGVGVAVVIALGMRGTRSADTPA